MRLCNGLVAGWLLSGILLVNAVANETKKITIPPLPELSTFGGNCAIELAHRYDRTFLSEFLEEKLLESFENVRTTLLGSVKSGEQTGVLETLDSQLTYLSTQGSTDAQARDAHYRPKPVAKGIVFNWSFGLITRWAREEIDTLSDIERDQKQIQSVREFFEKIISLVEKLKSWDHAKRPVHPIYLEIANRHVLEVLNIVEESFETLEPLDRLLDTLAQRGQIPSMEAAKRKFAKLESKISLWIESVERYESEYREKNKRIDKFTLSFPWDDNVVIEFLEELQKQRSDIIASRYLEAYQTKRMFFEAARAQAENAPAATSSHSTRTLDSWHRGSSRAIDEISLAHQKPVNEVMDDWLELEKEIWAYPLWRESRLEKDPSFSSHEFSLFKEWMSAPEELIKPLLHLKYLQDEKIASHSPPLEGQLSGQAQKPFDPSLKVRNSPYWWTLPYLEFSFRFFVSLREALPGEMRMDLTPNDLVKLTKLAFELDPTPGLEYIELIVESIKEWSQFKRNGKHLDIIAPFDLSECIAATRVKLLLGKSVDSILRTFFEITGFGVNTQGHYYMSAQAAFIYMEIASIEHGPDFEFHVIPDYFASDHSALGKALGPRSDFSHVDVARFTSFRNRWGLSSDQLSRMVQVVRERIDREWGISQVLVFIEPMVRNKFGQGQSVPKSAEILTEEDLTQLRLIPEVLDIYLGTFYVNPNQTP